VTKRYRDLRVWPSEDRVGPVPVLIDNRTDKIVASSTYSESAGVVLFLETESPEHELTGDRGRVPCSPWSYITVLAAAILGPSLKRLCDLVTG
jgi:hypothetical protein